MPDLFNGTEFNFSDYIKDAPTADVPRRTKEGPTFVDNAGQLIKVLSNIDVTKMIEMPEEDVLKNFGKCYYASIAEAYKRYTGKKNFRPVIRTVKRTDGNLVRFRKRPSFKNDEV